MHQERKLKVASRHIALPRPAWIQQVLIIINRRLQNGQHHTDDTAAHRPIFLSLPIIFT